MAAKSKIKIAEVFKFLVVVLLTIIFLMYLISKLYSQQLSLSQLEKDKKYYSTQRQTLEDEREKLEKQISQKDSKEYIEEIARKKLNMYYPDEKLYLDSSSRP